MRRKLCVLFTVFLLLGLLSSSALAAGKHETWNHVVDDMEKVLKQSYTTYTSGNVQKAKEEVDIAYFGFYEKLGFEKTVMAHISGNRAAAVEYQFSFVKKAMTKGAPQSEVKADLDKLVSMLRADAKELDGEEESSWGVFLASLLIITREGFEAIIIVGAIIAYLRKSGNADKTKAVYTGSLWALAASVVMAVILNQLVDGGEGQEITEGVTMLIAVAVLFYVSNWMVAKAEADAWSRYIKDKVDSSLSNQSVYALAFAAFLAVFREGAETILFYQALLANTREYINMVWIGLAVGCVLLVVIYYLINVLSVKLPLKPFFVGTSVLLCLMSISFLGAGIKELQEGNAIGVTALEGIPTIDLLGVYPTMETFIPQVVLFVVSVASFIWQMRKWQGSTPGTNPG